MKNLEQIRAKNALEAANNSKFKGINDGEVVKKVPAMIIQNGLLGALAFALDGKHDGHVCVLQACLNHYNDDNRPGYDKKVPRELDKFTAWLCNQDSNQLRIITAEFIAYLNYLRRFAKKE